MRVKNKMRWRIRESRAPGLYDLDFDGQTVTIHVDEDDCFETDGRPKFPLYAITYRVG